MADTKISSLPAASALTGAELVPIVQGGDTKKATAQDIADLADSPVTSVAGRTGAVTLAAADITDSTVTGRAVVTAADAAAGRTAIGAEASGAASTAVSAHAAATDPHGDRSYAAAQDSAHVAASDPHGDRAWASGQFAASGHAHTGTYDPAGTAAAAVAAHAGTGGTAHANAIAAGAAGFMSGADKTKLDGIAAGAEVNPASTDAVTEGSTNLYHTAARVLGQVLSGLSVLTNAAIDAADTVLAALGKLQAQITANLSTLTGHTSNTSNPHSTTAAQVGALATASNLSDLASASTARTNLGLGTAAALDVGTTAGNVVQVATGGKLPALDGSNLTGLSSGGSPGGSADGQVQVKSGTSFAASADLAFDAMNKVLTVGAGSAKNIKLDGPNGKLSFGFSSGSHGSRIDTEDGYPLDFYIATDRPLRVDYNYVSIHYNACYAFRYGAFTDARDAGFQHDTLADTIAVTDGSGMRTIYRDLKLRNLISTNVISPAVFTVATLPSASASGNGARAHVSDATTPTFGATVAGSGAVSTPVYSDGSAWRVG